MTRSPSWQKCSIRLRSSSMAMSANMSLPRIVRGPREPGARGFDDLLGNVDEHAVGPGLLPVALARGYPLDLVHPTPRRTPAVTKATDSSQFQCICQAPN